MGKTDSAKFAISMRMVKFWNFMGGVLSLPRCINLSPVDAFTYFYVAFFLGLVMHLAFVNLR